MIESNIALLEIVFKIIQTYDTFHGQKQDAITRYHQYHTVYQASQKNNNNKK